MKARGGERERDFRGGPFRGGPHFASPGGGLERDAPGEGYLARHIIVPAAREPKQPAVRQTVREKLPTARNRRRAPAVRGGDADDRVEDGDCDGDGEWTAWVVVAFDLLDSPFMAFCPGRGVSPPGRWTRTVSSARGGGDLRPALLAAGHPPGEVPRPSIL